MMGAQRMRQESHEANMLGNSEATYGAVTKTFHWLTVLLMVTVIPLGITVTIKRTVNQ